MAFSTTEFQLNPHTWTKVSSATNLAYLQGTNGWVKINCITPDDPAPGPTVEVGMIVNEQISVLQGGFDIYAKGTGKLTMILLIQ